MLKKLKIYIDNHQLLNERIKWFIIIVPIILPIIIGIIYIYSFGVNVPHWDQWYIIPLYEHVLDDKNLSIYDLFTQHNESRLLFPSILMIILALATHYNTVSDMFLMYILYCMSFIVIFLMYKKDHEISKISLLQFIPISWFFFNLFQMNNMLLGIRIAQALEILAFITAIYFIDSSKTLDKKFFGAIMSAIISTFSFVSGLLIWPVGLIQIILNGKREKIKKIFVWCTSGLLIFIIYFYDYIKPGHHPSILYSFYHPLDAVAIFISSIGSTITRDLLLSQIIGILIPIIICSILLLNRKNLDLDRNAKWLLLMTYSFFVSIEITIGRAGFENPYYGTAERYLLLTFFSIIGLYCISLNTLKIPDQIYKKGSQDLHNFNYLFLGIILCLLILGTSVFFVTGIEQGIKTKQSREETAYYLETYKIQPDKNLQKLYSDSSYVRGIAPFLEKYKLSVFSKKNVDISTLTRLDGDTLYYVDIINDKIVDQKGPITIDKEKDNEIRITGWAVDLPANMPAGAVFITIDNKMDIPTRYSIERKDVSDTLKNDNFRYSGFMASFVPTILNNGSHNVTIKILSADMTGYYEQKQKINIILT